MENFFYNDEFYPDIECLVSYLGIYEENVNELDDNYSIKVELSNLEPIFSKIDASYICQLLADDEEDRLTENFDEEEEIMKALNESIDFIALNEKIPKYYYRANNFATITKSDLVEYFKRNLI